MNFHPYFKMQTIVEKLRYFIRWFLIDTLEPEIALAKCKELNSQIPPLYLLIILNAVAAAYTYRDLAPAYLTIGTLTPILAFTALRLISWVRSRHIELTPQQAIRKLRQTAVLAGVIAALYVSWSFALKSYGGITEQSHVAIVITTTVFGCVFCLMHLPQAAILVMLIVTAPYLVFFLSKNQEVYAAIALNLFLVSLVILKVLFNSYNAFVNLIKSRTELATKHQETERLNRENERLSHTDFLTDLPNRRYFFKKIGKHLDTVKDSREPFTVGVIDLDHFKQINDTYGHKTGDQLLVAVASRIQNLDLPDLEICRLGGDEFGLLFLGAPHTAASVAQTICDRLQRPYQISEMSITIGASCGLAKFPEAGETTHELFDRSDYALYNSKTTVRGSVTVYSADHEAKIRSDRAIESALQRADVYEQFQVHLQPIVAVPDRTITGFEALARWTSPELGQISPDVFIQVAERTGQIQRLTVQLFAMAVDQISALPNNLRLSFNLSAHDISSPETVGRLLKIIKNHHIDPARITFEITETSVIDSYEAAETCLNKLRDAGCRLALDDFGTGYSSLGYLHKLPIDCVKIDRSFIANLDDPISGGVVTSVLNLCRTMQMACVVEGVENLSQLDALEELHCPFVQGYLFCPPMPFDEISESLARSDAIAGLPLASNDKTEHRHRAVV
ncbi:putative bifunctional diguanylate cyclase/phosphodiesterase [Roseibium sp.]|uniref:putative bifunctional diguanylate cyclase/phosphodiesterase n=1 Tax=Roseibium sp. TaxID=1936156 RepID=UPI003B518C5B